MVYNVWYIQHFVCHWTALSDLVPYNAFVFILMLLISKFSVESTEHVACGLNKKISGKTLLTFELIHTTCLLVTSQAREIILVVF